MNPRIIFIHGNNTMHWAFAWVPWVKEELEKKGYQTEFETFPDSILARRKYWLPFLKSYIKAGENDVLLGWSSGAVAAMRYAEENKILGSVLVSPCYTDLGDEMEKQSGYFDKPWSWEDIKKNQKHTALFCSDNDPWIPEEQFDFISDKLSAEKIRISGAKHFIERETFPEVVEYISKNYAVLQKTVKITTEHSG